MIAYYLYNANKQGNKIMSIYIQEYLENIQLFRVTVDSGKYFFEAYMNESEIQESICSNFYDYF